MKNELAASLTYLQPIEVDLASTTAATTFYKLKSNGQIRVHNLYKRISADLVYNRDLFKRFIELPPKNEETNLSQTSV